jgi:hypothetical protein
MIIVYSNFGALPFSREETERVYCLRTGALREQGRMLPV